jgi:two-component system phosphate regulon sensor histidine kinase PhoR
MDFIIYFLLTIIIILLYLLFKKNIKPENTAPVINKANTDDLGKRVIIEELEDQFFALDKYNSIKYLNKSAKQRFGENLIDKNISSVVRDTKLLEKIEEAIKDQTTKNVNVEINLPSYQLYKIYIIPGPTHLFPEIDSVVLFLKDFTEITKAQKLKTDFVANVSHELRTPLVSIKGSLETILGPASDDKVAQKKFMSIMSDQVLRMENLINDLLILSRIELEEHIKPNKIVNLNDIFTNIKSNFELILKKKKINLQIELMEPTLVFGDNDKLLTVFSNLIDNAIKYSQDGKNIYIKSQNSEGKLIGKNMLINIKDEGIGIPQDLIPRITERFFRVDTEKSKKVGGTGLGLAIMKHIISQHRGDYEILSKVNEGTEIKIYLPTK